MPSALSLIIRPVCQPCHTMAMAVAMQPGKLSCGLRRCRAHRLLGKLTRWCCGWGRGCCCCQAPGSVNADQRLERAAQMHQLLLHLAQAGQAAHLLLLLLRRRWWQHDNHRFSGSRHWHRHRRWRARRNDRCGSRCRSPRRRCSSRTAAVWRVRYAVHQTAHARMLMDLGDDWRRRRWRQYKLINGANAIVNGKGKVNFLAASIRSVYGGTHMRRRASIRWTLNVTICCAICCWCCCCCRRRRG